jgi:hypothetical protein
MKSVADKQSRRQSSARAKQNRRLLGIVTWVQNGSSFRPFQPPGISAYPSPVLNLQREVVAIFTGNVPTVLRIDGDFFHYYSLEGWAQKARFIIFHYHAFTLYNALLVEAQSIALDAVKECQVWSGSVQGIAFTEFPFS